jgi:hypothetical protein
MRRKQVPDIMSKTSANPRKYSRGHDHLNPEQNLCVYMSLFLTHNDIAPTAGRLNYLGKKHPDAVWKIVELAYDELETRITVEVQMGPAREALNGEHPQTLAGYAYLWDIAKVLFYASPVFAAPPQLGDEERKAAAKAFRKIQTIQNQDVQI